MSQKPVNVVSLKDESREIVIYKESDKFLVHTKNFETLDESLTEYSVEGFVKTTKLMMMMYNQLIDNDKVFVSKALNITKSQIKTNLI